MQQVDKVPTKNSDWLIYNYNEHSYWKHSLNFIMSVVRVFIRRDPLAYAWSDWWSINKIQKKLRDPFQMKAYNLE